MWLADLSADELEENGERFAVPVVGTEPCDEQVAVLALRVGDWRAGISVESTAQFAPAVGYGLRQRIVHRSVQRKRCFVATVKSNSRPATNGPRSRTRTVTRLPLRGFRNRTFVPHGRVLCATPSVDQSV